MQKRSRLGFDESDKEDMLELLSGPSSPVGNPRWLKTLGQSPRDSRALGDSSVFGAPEESMDTPLRQIEREMEMPEERLYY